MSENESSLWVSVFHTQLCVKDEQGVAEAAECANAAVAAYREAGGK